MKLKSINNFNKIVISAVIILIISTLFLLIHKYPSKEEYILNKKIEDWKHDITIVQNYVDAKKVDNQLNDIEQFYGITDMSTEIRFAPDKAYKLNIRSSDIDNRVSQNFIDSCGITNKGEIVYAKGITFDKYTIYYSEGYIFKITELSGLLNSEDEKNLTNGMIEY